MQNSKIEDLLSNVDSLVKNLYLFSVDVKFPANTKAGVSIAHSDLKERRSDFLRELKNTICSWVYGKSKYKNLFEDELAKRNSDYQNVASHIEFLARKKFRKGHPQGQFGELLLFNFIQFFFEAPAILRKMPLTTNSSVERFGADAIHYKEKQSNNILYLGQAKTYESKYQFNAAMEASVKSILKTYEEIEDEMLLYTYDDFIEPELQEIAKSIQDNDLPNVKYELVSVVSYNETKNKDEDCEEKINQKVKEIVASRLASCDKADDVDKNILKRMHFIVFPIWELDKLLKDFEG